MRVERSRCPLERPSDGVEPRGMACLRQAARSYYPMAWDLTNREVMGEERTEWYEAACNKC